MVLQIYGGRGAPRRGELFAIDPALTATAFRSTIARLVVDLIFSSNAVRFRPSKRGLETLSTMMVVQEVSQQSAMSVAPECWINFILTRRT